MRISEGRLSPDVASVILGRLFLNKFRINPFLLFRRWYESDDLQKH